ncbi:MAG TPA: hypothetical protein VHY37_06625 [Tepidisphaeraceae bacterium]|jgi:hypothetical protein|nr:hypothetical protein [Tepidisphaeraceae bacterium]
MKKSLIEQFLRLSEAEKQADIAPFLKEKVKTRPLTPAQRRRWNRIKHGLGRPKIGKGAVVVPISLERGFLKEVDAFAKANHLKRSHLVAQGLRLVMRKKAS